jgi:hypothetical protein
VGRGLFLPMGLALAQHDRPREAGIARGHVHHRATCEFHQAHEYPRLSVRRLLSGGCLVLSVKCERSSSRQPTCKVEDSPRAKEAFGVPGPETASD